MKENAPKLGQLIDGEAFKDAIHIAVAPVVAGMGLSAGSHVMLVDGKAMQTNTKGIGVVDPFLKTYVPKGASFYLFLYHGTITGLRHEWTHPAFVEHAVESTPAKMPVSEKEMAESRLRQYASECGVSYDRLINAADDGDYIHMGDNEHYNDVSYPSGGTFQTDCELVLGKEGDFYPRFSCSC